MGVSTRTYKKADGSTGTRLVVENGSQQDAGGVTLFAADGSILIGQQTKANSLPVVLPSNQVGTAGVPATDVLSVQGVVGGTAVPTISANTATATATIASAGSLSGAIDFGSTKDILRLMLPAAWTAASLTCQMSEDGTTYNDYYDAYGVEYTIVVSASREVQIPAGDLRGVRYLKLRSGTSASPVVQGGSRDISVVAR